MSTSSSDEVDEILNEAFEEIVDQHVDNFIDSIINVQANTRTRRAYIERDREQGHKQLWTTILVIILHIQQTCLGGIFE